MYEIIVENIKMAIELKMNIKDSDFASEFSEDNDFDLELVKTVLKECF